MATKKGGKCKRSYFRAHLVTNVETCAFCQRAVDDEILYGKLYAIGDIQCHYFCALLSCCLVQKGTDEEGLFGFLYPDILAEVERSKKHKCSYCNREGASVGCSVTQCRKQFHLPCGRERNAVSLFYGNFKSFCENHAPKQKLTDAVAANVKLRIAAERRQKHSKCVKKTDGEAVCDDEAQSAAEAVCVICYEAVAGRPSAHTFWPPCCARDAWFHRACLQRMALSAGMHYLKCPLCNDKETFHKAVISQGYYLPDRDAAWELEQDAFAEIYERPLTCRADTCKCPNGRDHVTDSGAWDIKLCILCGSMGTHAQCMGTGDGNAKIYICHVCQPAAPADLDRLVATVESVQLQQQTTETPPQGRVMPSRMSLRRTKGRDAHWNRPSSSRMSMQKQNEAEIQETKTTTDAGRLELNLKKPQRRTLELTDKNTHNVFFSPTKMLEQGLNEKMAQLEKEASVDPSEVLEKLRDKLRKPRPLVEKKRIVTNILEEIFNNILKDPKVKDPVMEWHSPKKVSDLKREVKTPKKTTDEKSEVNRKTFKENVNRNENNGGMFKTNVDCKSEVVNNIDGKKVVAEQNGFKTIIDGKKVGTEDQNGLKNDVDEKDKLTEDKSPKDTNKLSKENTSMKNLDMIDLEGRSGNVSSLETVLLHEKSCDINDLLMDWTTPEKIYIELECKKNLHESTEKPSSTPSKSPTISNTSPAKTTKSVLQYKEDKNEVFKCSFKHKHIDKEIPQSNLRTAINFALDAYKCKEKKLKRKASPQFRRNRKRRKINKGVSVLDVSNDLGVNETNVCVIKEELKKEKVTPTRYNTSLRRIIIDNDISNDLDMNVTNLVVEEDSKEEKESPKCKYNTSLKRKLIALDAEDTNLVNKENVLDEKIELKYDSDKIDSSTKGAKIRRGNNLKRKAKNDIKKDYKVIRKSDDKIKGLEDQKVNAKRKFNFCLRNKARKKQEKQAIASKTDDNDSGVEIKEEKREYDNNKSFELDTEINLKDSEVIDVDNDKAPESTKKRNIKNDKQHRKSDIRRINVKNKLKSNVLSRKKKSVKIDTDSTSDNHVISLTLNNKDNAKHKKKHKKMVSIRNKDIKVKIRWKERQLKLKITEKKQKKTKCTTPKVFKQYVLKYSPEASPKEVIVKPECDVTLVKRKYVRTEKVEKKDASTLVQTDISSFFKSTPKPISK